MIGAEPFASSTAGYLSGIVLPIAFAMFAGICGWVLKGIKARFDQINHKIDRIVDAQTVSNQTLAILNSDAPAVEARLNSTETRLGELERTTAVLSVTLQRHEQFHERKFGTSVSS